METGLELSSPGWIVLLNGTSSAGKSTLARALHELLPERYYYRSLDHFRQGYADRYWFADDGTLFRRVMKAYLLSLRALALLGHNVIAEAVITPDRLGTYLNPLHRLPGLPRWCALPSGSCAAARVGANRPIQWTARSRRTEC
jgi:chloramphenicol 3-O-phosphotransferase